MSNRFYLVLGFLCPWPLFFDVQDLSPIVLNFTPEDYTLGFDDKVPVPLGLFTLTLFILLVSIQRGFFLSTAIKCLPVLLVGYAFFHEIGDARFVSLFLPIIFLAYCYRITMSLNALNEFVKGYLIGTSLFYLLYFLSSLYLFVFTQIDPLVHGYGLFIFEIYQFFVTVSAIASLVYGISLICLMLPNSNQHNLRFLLYTIFFLTPCLFYFALRKAALAESLVAFCLASVMVLFFRQFSTLKNFLLAAYAGLVYSSFYITITNIRDVSLEGAKDQRLDAYQIFLNEIERTDLYGLLFGYTTGFGGYSNLFVDLVARGGLLGTAFYSIVFILVIAKIFLMMLPKRSQIYYFQKKMVGVLLIIYFMVSIIIGNMANLNLVVPYYSINLLCIILVSIVVLSQANESQKAEA